MKAWRWYSLGDMRLDDVPMPQTRPGWVLARVKVVQPSVTEAQRALGVATQGLEKIKKSIEKEAPVRLFGHELCAEIVETGEGVQAPKVGQRVVVYPRMPCYNCELCSSGQKWACRKGPTIGKEIPGGFAEYATFPAELMVVLPDSVSDKEGAALQPASTCVRAVRGSGIQLGDTVVVLGQGCMGNYIMQLSRFAGAGRVIGVDVREEALELAANLGADEVVNARQVDPVARVLDLTGGRGADVVFEAAGGSPEAGLAGHKTLLQAFDMAKDEGRVMQIAWQGAAVSLDIDDIRSRGIDFLMSKGEGVEALRAAASLVASKRLQVLPLITHTLSGLEKASEAFKMTISKSQYKLINPVQVIVS